MLPISFTVKASLILTDSHFLSRLDQGERERLHEDRVALLSHGGFPSLGPTDAYTDSFREPHGFLGDSSGDGGQPLTVAQ